MNATSPKQAVEKSDWWPGWIWLVPIAAIGLAGWLGYRSLASSGPSVNVVFPEVADLKPGNTKVTFEGMEVGSVVSSRLEPDLKHVRAKLSMDSDMQDHLGPGTKFWIIGKTVSISHLSDLKALIGGVSIGIIPKPGHAPSVFQGLSEPPVLGYGAEGSTYHLHAGTLGSVQRGTPIYYLDQHVGQVVSYEMTGSKGFDITVFIDHPYDRFVHDHSLFWRAGPLHITTGGNGPSVDFQSIPALVEGALAFETPAGDNGPPGPTYTLFGSKDAAEYAPTFQSVPYRVVFKAASGVPAKDAPVKLMGQRVGSVEDANLRYDPADGRMDVAATIMLDPNRIALPAGQSWHDPKAQMDDMLRHLISQGLRAELSASPPVIGGQLVSLQIVPGEGGSLGQGDVPEIPSSSGGGMQGIMSSVNNVMTKVNEMPLPAIAENLHTVSQNLAALSRSPALHSSLQRMDVVTANLDRVSTDLKAQLPATLAALRRTVAQAQQSLAAAHGLLSAQGGGNAALGTAALPETLYEINRTARSLRALTDMLDQHPQALLTGRGASR
jgi:paraquat-inducible protein B